MADQSTADAGIDRVTARGNSFQFDRRSFKAIATPMRRIIIHLDIGGLVRASPLGFDVIMPLVDVGSRLDAPSGEQSILTFEPSASDDQLIDRFLNSLELGSSCFGRPAVALLIRMIHMIHMIRWIR
ncbi:MAG: hypothetical protein CMJ54_03470 [Planctomycetaceae bacterium]|nr:hypothetical protein [Planctomycetaceae bacterium]